tara:strand:+ start:26 stop:403 length:378 start_codon:yes stop_codon:yes gene_type:complete
MGYNMSNDIPLGQLGSGFVDTNSVTLVPPSGKVIIAITFMDDTSLDVLTPEVPTDATFKGPQTSAGVAETNCVGIPAQTAANGAGSQVIDTSQVFPKGLTLYGRWTAFSMQLTVTTGGCIAYYGY